MSKEFISELERAFEEGSDKEEVVEVEPKKPKKSLSEQAKKVRSDNMKKARIARMKNLAEKKKLEAKFKYEELKDDSSSSDSESSDDEPKKKKQKGKGDHKMKAKLQYLESLVNKLKKEKKPKGNQPIYIQNTPAVPVYQPQQVAPTENDKLAQQIKSKYINF